MRYEKIITINLGGYQSMKLGITDAPSFADCDKHIIGHLKELGIPVDKDIHQALRWCEE